MARRAGGPARRPREDRGLLPEPRLRDGARRPAAHHVHRQAGRQQEEARQVHEARDPHHRGRAVQDGQPEVRGPHGAEGAVRALALQDERGRRLQRLALQEGLREAARRLRLARLLPVDGRHRPQARPREEGGRRHREDGGGQAVLPRQAQLHRQRLDARQGDPARDLHERGRRLQHRGPQDVDQARQPARLLQADGERARHPAEPGGREQGRRHLQGPGAEPQPVHLRRRRLRLRRRLHQRLVLDHQLPGRGRDVPDLRPERGAHQELLAVGERALLPRPPDHGRRRPLQAQDHVLQLRQRGGLHAGVDGREPRDGASWWASGRAPTSTTPTR